MFKRKYSITILDENWSELKTNIRLSIVPKEGELIYMEEFNKYFNVVRVIHYLKDKTQGIFIVVNNYLHQKDDK